MRELPCIPLCRSSEPPPREHPPFMSPRPLGAAAAYLQRCGIVQWRACGIVQWRGLPRRRDAPLRPLLRLSVLAGAFAGKRRGFRGSRCSVAADAAMLLHRSSWLQHCRLIERTVPSVYIAFVRAWRCSVRLLRAAPHGCSLVLLRW
jgi:hypothetical protein